jgi:hypothetical protein
LEKSRLRRPWFIRHGQTAASLPPTKGVTFVGLRCGGSPYAAIVTP